MVVGCSPANTLLVFCDYAEDDVVVGHTFNRILNEEQTVLYNGSIILRRVSQQFCEPFDAVPHGWKTICLFEFKEGTIPAAMYYLNYVDTWFASKACIIFT